MASGAFETGSDVFAALLCGASCVQVERELEKTGLRAQLLRLHEELEDCLDDREEGQGEGGRPQLALKPYDREVVERCRASRALEKQVRAGGRCWGRVEGGGG